MVRARGNFNRCMFDEAKRRSARPTEHIVADYRRLDGSRKHPPGLTPLDPLVDVLVHTQDIVRPLGRSTRCRLGRRRPRRAMCGGTGRFRSARASDCGGYRLTATDVAVVGGDGPAIEGSMGAILLLLTGRTVSLPELSGDGAGQLSQTPTAIRSAGRPSDRSR